MSSTMFLYLLISYFTMSIVEPIENDMDDIDPSEVWTAEERGVFPRDGRMSSTYERVHRGRE